MKKPRILVLTGFYLPGFKSGGPLRSIVNMIAPLHEDFEFWVITSDRDLGDDEPYVGIAVDEWIRVGHAMVRYLPPSKRTPRAIWGAIEETHVDLIYLNSFFAPWFTIYPLLGRRLGRIQNIPILLAPRGEFSSGAVSLKPIKKRIYILAAKAFSLLKDVKWHASSACERRDIEIQMGASNGDIFIASDLSEPASPELPTRERDNNEYHVVFLSRIARMKNLDFALDVLAMVRSEVVFNIFGPIEDALYWKLCQSKINELPGNIHVKYHGPVSPSLVRSVLRENDIFFLPTRGENYGHVIAEALSVGTPVLISDQTPWRSLHMRGLGKELPLGVPAAFAEYIDEMASTTRSDMDKNRISVHRNFQNSSEGQIDLEANRQMFRSAIQCKPKG